MDQYEEEKYQDQYKEGQLFENSFKLRCYLHLRWHILKNVVFFPLYSKLSTCIPVFLQVLRQSRVCGAARAREPGKWVLSWWRPPLITTCPHSSYNIFQTSPLISRTFACSCPSDLRSPPGSLRIKEGASSKSASLAPVTLFWPNNNFTSKFC